MPAHIVNGGGDERLKMAGFPNYKGSWPWHWPWIGSYCILPCITYRPLPTRQISLVSKTDVRMYVRRDGHLRPILLGQLRRVDLKNELSYTSPFKVYQELHCCLHTRPPLCSVTPDIPWMGLCMPALFITVCSSLCLKMFKFMLKGGEKPISTRNERL